MDSLAFLAVLPSLNELEISRWPYDTHPYYEEEEAFRLPRVETIRLEGDGADEDSVKALVNICPALLSIDLDSGHSGSQTSFAPALGTLPSTLHSLKLRTNSEHAEYADPPLSRFSALRSLDLGDGCYPGTIHQVLSRLPLLVDVRLEQGAIYALGFLDLVSGPGRLPNLKTIYLDSNVGRVGNRTSFHETDIESIDPGMLDWQCPDEWCGEGPGYVEEGFATKFQELITVAEANGVRIEGTIHEALKTFEDSHIESNNRTVLAFYRSGGSDSIASLHNACYRMAARVGVLHPALKGLNLDYLKSGHYELVEIPLPERDWFIYTLRSRGTVSQEEDVSGEGSS